MNLSLVFSEVVAIATSVGRSFLHILPYLALSVPLAVIFKRAGVADKIRSGLSSNLYLAVLMATLVGAVSPFCSCGVIPIVTALLLGGVPLAPVMSFWLASPSIDPKIFILSVGSVGWELAVWRLTATFVISLGGGLAVLWLEKMGWIGPVFLRPSLRHPGKTVNSTHTGPPVPAACCVGPSAFVLEDRETIACESASIDFCGGGQRHAEERTPACDCSSNAGWWGVMTDTVRTTLNLSIFMLIAFLLEALTIRYVPTDLIGAYLGNQSAWGVPLATLISLPMYTTNLTSLGLIAGLLQRGMSGGAALAFLIGGAITALPALSAVYGIVRGRVFLLYIGFCIGGSMLSGFAYQFAHSVSR